VIPHICTEYCIPYKVGRFQEAKMRGVYGTQHRRQHANVSRRCNVQKGVKPRVKSFRP
jgi:hypothetical protein